MHADGLYGRQLPELFEVAFEIFVSVVQVAVADGEAFVVVTDFVAQVVYLFDDGFFPALGHGPEVVCATDIAFGLDFGKCQGVLRPGIHMVAQDDGFIGRVFDETGEGLKNIALVLQGREEVFVCF